jgi:alanyl-tRNA synthetase
MTSEELRKKFIKFFSERGHKVIPSASLVPENDPSVLFTTAGMHPLVPYLMGEKHPLGKQIVNAQKCIRTGDIEEVGNTTHHTFFEMLGNWSFGDYWKEDAIKWSFEFLTSKEWLGIPVEKLAISVFGGDADAPFDEESFNIWKELGIPEERVAKLPKKNNWWGPAGECGPCGPDVEMFHWSGEGDAPEKFDPEDSRWVEIWNDVFMQYNKTAEGKFEALKQKNVDTGMGLERTLAVLNCFDDNYRTDLFWPIIQKIEEISGKSYEGNEKEMRIIADHIKAATMAIADGVRPSNKDAGYMVRRLIRRAIVKGKQIGIEDNFTPKLAEKVFEIYKGIYFNSHPRPDRGSNNNGNQLVDSRLHGNDRMDGGDDIKNELDKEEEKFRVTLDRGLKFLDEHKKVNGKVLFDLYQTYGIPIEISREEYQKRGIELNDETMEQYNNETMKHQELSRTASAGMFKGGLADASEETKKLHTAAHLLLAALRKVLGGHVTQKGSNITAERLRFDFSHPEKLTDEQKAEVEKIVNEIIKKDLPVMVEEMTLDEAKKSGATGVFEHKYGDKVKVYTINGPHSTLRQLADRSGSRDTIVSREICGGPHVAHTGELGKFRIKKEESSSAGIRRIKAVLE